MLDRVVKPQVGLVRSVRRPTRKERNPIKKNKCQEASVNINTLPDPRARQQNKIMTDKISEEIDFSKPRDLYNRQNLLKNSLAEVNKLPSPDREDILAHVQYLNDNRRAKLTVIRNVSALIKMVSLITAIPDRVAS